MSFFVRVIPQPVIDEILFLIFLSSKLSPASTRTSSFSFLAPIFLDSFATDSANEIFNWCNKYIRGYN